VTGDRRSGRPWWRDAVFYQIYVRSFADSDGDGVGDLTGIRNRLPYLRRLGVDALWLTPFYPSPMADHGYDVADPRGVDPLFGGLTGFDELMRDAHALGLRVTIDLVPNHSSDRHPWFAAALAAGPGSPERDRYIFRDGRGTGGGEPPNNWDSVFGGPAWTRVQAGDRPGQWYLHMFAVEQPDLNWRNADVRADYERTLRFWLDRGVDGFRVDVAHGLVKDELLRDNPGRFDPDRLGHGENDRYSWDHPEVHDIYRDWRRLLDSYEGERMAVGEVWLVDVAATARYVRADELHLVFNFRLLLAGWDATELRAAIDASTAAMREVGAPASWVLSNHDVVRHPSRYGGGATGRVRARAAALLLLALPGVAFLYAGEELGLPQVDVPAAARQDPIWERSGHTRVGRDGARVPLPWSGNLPPYGFSPDGVPPWLPMPADWGRLTVATQEGDPGSMLALYRQALAVRRSEIVRRPGTLRWLHADDDCLVFERGGFVCALNAGRTPMRLAPGRLLLASGPLVAGKLPPNTAAWLVQD
jgi:alpha-glucosidase